jgi:hypothetical protein
MKHSMRMIYTTPMKLTMPMLYTLYIMYIIYGMLRTCRRELVPAGGAPCLPRQRGRLPFMRSLSSSPVAQVLLRLTPAMGVKYHTHVL